MNPVSVLLLLLVLGFMALAIRAYRKKPPGCDGNCCACKKRCPKTRNP